uniref:Uncharacterized protein n=1 Tax=Leersia perrieri TaxID=77586 RepID=A0A0D9X022_9ORYZ
MEIFLYSAEMIVRFPLLAAVVGSRDDKFTCLTKLQMSELWFSSNGEGMSDVISRRYPRLEILKFESIGQRDVVSLMPSATVAIVSGSSRWKQGTYTSTSTPARSERRASVSGAAYEGPDRISSLADELLHQILVLLPVVEAIRTCVLSRRWIRVWTGLPSLRFDDDAAEEVESFAGLVDGVLGRYDAAVGLRDLVVSVHGDDVGFGNDDVISCVDAAARLVTGSFTLDVPRGIDMLEEDYDYEDEEEVPDLLELPCFERATEIAICVSDMEVRLMRRGGDDGRTFALLTKLHLSQVVLADDGEYLSDVVSRGCPQLETLELVDIYSGVTELTIRSTSLLTLLLWSISDLLRLEVDAENLTSMQVRECFDMEETGSVMSLSTPAMKEFFWEDCCPEEVKLVREPAGCLQKITCIDSSWKHSLTINQTQSYYTRILELFSSTCTDVLRIEFPIKPESEEHTRFVHNVKLPYYSELQLVVRKNGHTLAPTIVHLLKKNRWIKRFSLKISLENNTIQCEPFCTCRQPSNWRDQQISLGSLEGLAIQGCRGTSDEKELLYYITENSKALKKSVVVTIIIGNQKSTLDFLHNVRLPYHSELQAVVRKNKHTLPSHSTPSKEKQVDQKVFLKIYLEVCFLLSAM